MAHINVKNRVIQGKIVYYGAGLCGKTTNLIFINRTVPNAKDMMSLSTEGDRTIFFDYLPMDLGKVRGISTTFKLYTVPGQVRYNQTRKMVLKNVDGVVFVADSQPAMMDANLESLDNLYANLEELGINADDIPIVMQYNKRDLAPVMSPEDMRRQLNLKGYPELLASATQGTGVIETLAKITSLVFEQLSSAFGEAPDKAAAAAGPPRPPAAAATSAAAAPGAAAGHAPSAPPPVPPPSPPAAVAKTSVEAAPRGATATAASLAAVATAPTGRVTHAQTVESPAATPARKRRSTKAVEPVEPPGASAAALTEISRQLHLLAEQQRGLEERLGAQIQRLGEPRSRLARARASAVPRPEAGSASDFSSKEEEITPSSLSLSGDEERLVHFFSLRLDLVKNELRDKDDKIEARLSALADSLAKVLSLQQATSEASSRSHGSRVSGEDAALLARAVSDALKGELAGKADLANLRGELRALQSGGRAAEGSALLRELHGLSGRIVDELRARMGERGPGRASLSSSTEPEPTPGRYEQGLEKLLEAMQAVQGDLQKLRRELPPREHSPALAAELRELSLALPSLRQEVAALRGEVERMRRDLLTRAAPPLTARAASEDTERMKKPGGAESPTAERDAETAGAAPAVARPPAEEVTEPIPPAGEPTSVDAEPAVGAPAAAATEPAAGEPAAGGGPRAKEPVAAAAETATRAPAVAAAGPRAEEAPAAAAGPHGEAREAAPVTAEPTFAATSTAESEPPAEEPTQIDAKPRVEESAPTGAEAPGSGPPAALEGPHGEKPSAPAKQVAGEVQTSPDRPSPAETPLPLLDDDPRHKNAGRIARVMVADLNLYFGSEVTEAVKAGNFHERLKDALEDMRKTFESRVPADVRAERDHLKIAIESFLAKKRRELGLEE